MRNLVLSIVVLLLSISLSAQNDDGKRIVLGFHGQTGFGFFSPDTKDYESDGALFSKGFGLRIDYNFAQNYVFSSGINVDYTGGKLLYPHEKDVDGDGNPSIGVLHRKYNSRYMEIPMNLVLKTNQIGYFTYYLRTGINNSFRMRAKMDDKFIYDDLNGDEQTNISEELEAKENIAFYKASFLIGLGTEYALGKSFSLYGLLYYNSSLNDVLKGKNSVNNDIKEYAKLNQIGLRIGILF